MMCLTHVWMPQAGFRDDFGYRDIHVNQTVVLLDWLGNPSHPLGNRTCISAAHSYEWRSWRFSFLSPSGWTSSPKQFEVCFEMSLFFPIVLPMAGMAIAVKENDRNGGFWDGCNEHDFDSAAPTECDTTVTFFQIALHLTQSLNI
jgi:hypothetical protein